MWQDLALTLAMLSQADESKPESSTALHKHTKVFFSIFFKEIRTEGRRLKMEMLVEGRLGGRKSSTNQVQVVTSEY